MLLGGFYSNYPNIPYVEILIGWGQSIQQHAFVLDTGFTGELKLTRSMADQLGLQVVGVTPLGMVNGEALNFPVALAIADMEGVKNRVTVIIGDGFPVLGIGVLIKFGYRACVDCKYKTVNLERA